MKNKIAELRNVKVFFFINFITFPLRFQKEVALNLEICSKILFFNHFVK
jgi:hypothetical protein